MALRLVTFENFDLGLSPWLLTQGLNQVQRDFFQRAEPPLLTDPVHHYHHYNDHLADIHGVFIC